MLNVLLCLSQALAFHSPVLVEGTHGITNAAGDFDGDGYQDLVLSFSQHWMESGFQVWRGTPTPGAYTLSYEHINGPGTGSSMPAYVAVADVDGDGAEDIVYTEGLRFRVLLGDGAGGFAVAQGSGEPWIYPSPQRLAFADLDGDRLPEVLLAAPDSAGVRLATLPNLGQGRFGAPRWLPITGSARWMVAAELDGRPGGGPELVVAESTARRLTIWSPDAGGGFTQLATIPVDQSAGQTATDVTVGDFNGDGRVDIAFISGPNGRALVVENLGGLQFATRDLGPVGEGPVRITALDVSGDGRLDLVTANLTSEDVTVLHGNGDGTFDIVQRAPIGEQPLALLGFDHDRDGALDLIVGQVFGGAHRVLRNRGAGTFAAPMQVPLITGLLTADLDLGDLNGDGRLDIVVLDASAGALHTFQNMGGLEFAVRVETPTGVQAQGRSKLADVDGDGRLDAVVVGTGVPGIRVLYGRGDTTFEPAETVDFGAALLEVAVEDLDGDGLSELLGKSLHVLPTGAGRHDVHIARQTPPRRFVTTVPTALRTEVATWSFGDFNGDGFRDLGLGLRLWGDRYSWTVLYARGPGFAPFAVGPLWRFPAGRPVPVPDLDGDGRADFLAQEYLALGWSRGLGLGQVSPLGRRLYRSPILESQVADVDGDGHLDLVVGPFQSGALHIARGDGTGAFGPDVKIGLSRGSRLRVADLDADGLPDLVWAVGNGARVLANGQR